MKHIFLKTAFISSITCQTLFAAVIDLTDDVAMLAPHAEVIDLSDDDEAMAPAGAPPAGAIVTPVKVFCVDEDPAAISPIEKELSQGVKWPKFMLNSSVSKSSKALDFSTIVVEPSQSVDQVPHQIPVVAAVPVVPAVGGAGIAPPMAAPAAPIAQHFYPAYGPHTMAYPFAAKGISFVLPNPQIAWAIRWQSALSGRGDLGKWQKLRPLANYVPPFGWTKLWEGTATHPENCRMCGNLLPAKHVVIVSNNYSPAEFRTLRVDANCAVVMTATRNQVRQAAGE